MRLKSIISVAMIAGMVACTPESEMMPEVLKMDLANQSLSALQTEVKVTVQCDLHWKAELADPSWANVEVLTENKGQGGTFVVRFSENLEEDERENTITLKAGKAEISKSFKQGGLAKFLTPRTIELTGTEKATVSFPSPGPWTASVVGDTDWLTLVTSHGSAGKASLICAATGANEAVGAREATIRLTIGEISLDIPVSQAQKDIVRIDGNDKITVSYLAQTLTLQTLYNIDYDVKTDASWITKTTTKAPLYEGVETFSIEQNPYADPRTGTITFSGAGAKDLVVTVTQEGRDPVLNVIVPGFYGIYGQNFYWGVDGWNQRTNLVSQDGVSRYRLLNAEELSMLQVDGLRFSETDGEEMVILVSVKGNNFRRPAQEYYVTQIGHTDNMYWFKASNSTFFVVNK